MTLIRLLLVAFILALGVHLAYSAHEMVSRINLQHSATSVKG